MYKDKLKCPYFNVYTDAHHVLNDCDLCTELHEALKTLQDWVINLPDDSMTHVLEPAPLNKVTSALLKGS